jgi:hypothetical protein
MELSTRQSYTYVIKRYILPEFRALRMIEIMPGTVRDFVRKMQNDGASPYTIDKARTILSAIFTTALNDQITPYVVEVGTADHGMFVPGELSASAAVLGRVMTAVEQFLDQVVWP